MNKVSLHLLLTIEWLLSSMSSHVWFKTRPFCKCYITVAALVWFSPVWLLICVKKVCFFVCESFATLGALIYSSPVWASIWFFRCFFAYNPCYTYCMLRCIPYTELSLYAASYVCQEYFSLQKLCHTGCLNMDSLQLDFHKYYILFM